MSVQRMMLLGVPAVLIAAPFAVLGSEHALVSGFERRADRVRAGMTRNAVEALVGAPTAPESGGPDLTRVEYRRVPRWMIAAEELPLVGAVVPDGWTDGWKLVLTYDSSDVVEARLSERVSSSPFIYFNF